MGYSAGCHNPICGFICSYGFDPFSAFFRFNSCHSCWYASRVPTAWLTRWHSTWMSCPSSRNRHHTGAYANSFTICFSPSRRLLFAFEY